VTQNRWYSSTTKATTLTADPGATGTTLTVTDSTVFASLDGKFPYTLAINWGQADQELVNVTARPSNTTLTVTRGQDGTAGVSHPVGAVVDHEVSARDFNEAGAHVGASSGVHGLTGSVVGTTDTQTLTGKTIGDNLTVSGNLSVGGIGKTLYVSKPGDTSLTSNVTLTNDPDLTVTLAANATYLMTSTLKYEADAAGDLNVSWVGPAGASSVGSLVALLSSATSDANVYINNFSLGGSFGIGGRGAGANRGAFFNGVVTTGASAGSLTLQWAQLTSSTIATILHAGSYVTLQRFA
jgi:hypothetical protein